MELNRVVAGNMRQIRMSVGMSQSELAGHLGFSYPNAIVEMEKGRTPITLDVLESFCLLFETTAYDMLKSMDEYVLAMYEVKELREKADAIEMAANKKNLEEVERILNVFKGDEDAGSAGEG